VLLVSALALGLGFAPGPGRASASTTGAPPSPGNAGASSPGDDGVADPSLVSAPTRSGGAWVAKILVDTTARRHPGSRRVVSRVLRTVPGTDHAQELLVLDRGTSDAGRVAWLKVRLARRPNTAAGWIRASAVRLRRTDWWIDVDVGARRVRVYRHGRLHRSLRAVVGAPGTPTPRGLFAVLLVARQPDPRGFIGPWAIHLTAHSDVLENYGGGPGRVALHGRGGASLLDPLGSARSHGCVRVDNAAVTDLAGILRPGVPVRIRG
jgi:hypothetical protein